MSSASSPPTVVSASAAARGSSGLHRAFDVACASAGLLLLSPLCALIAASIKFDDGGRVFYLQDRVGKDFRHFRVLKFRSMVEGAERKGLLTALDDSRLTRAGRWLRRYKLDELPQLINVLKGDMQLVGPRPEVERYVETFHQQYTMLLQDRPGITDAATLTYSREEKLLVAGQMEKQYLEEILPEKLKLSLAYQRQRTFFSDVGILFRTIVRLFA